MEKSDGESRRSDGLDCPVLLNFQGKVVEILVACIVFSLAYTLVTHASQHNPDGTHKTAQIQGTTCRWAGGALVEKRETFNAQRSTPNFDGPETNGVWAAAAGMRPRPDCTRRGATCPHYRQPGGRCGLSRGLCRAPAERQRLSSGFAGVVLGAEDLPHLRWCRDLFDGQIHVLERFLESPPAAAADPRLGNQANEPAGAKAIHSIGNFNFLANFEDVWFNGEHYDLRRRAKARFCLQYLVAKKAFDPVSARHLEKEIDPFVRNKCNLPPPSEIRIQHYFNDRSGKLSRLRSELVKSAGRNGRFYLQVV